MASNKRLMGCRPLPDWPRDKRCIHTIATFDGNLCVWRCLAIYKRHVRCEKNQVENCRAALDLACEYNIICSCSKFKHILNSSEKVFYGGEAKSSYTACQWIQAQAIETCKHIHHKMCGHGECLGFK